VDALIFDFDGVLTNNLVTIDSDGNEFVSCSRADGLAFDVLRKSNKAVFIVSTEKNKIVQSRADKLNVKCYHGVESKVDVIMNISKENNYKLSNILYVGNDLNDYKAMKLCGYTACPVDSHDRIKDISLYVLKTRGGMGIARELVESVFGIDITDILYG